jgi:hypothetical protein
MPDEIKAVSSYEQDFSAWALAQAAALRVVRDAMASAGRRRVVPASVLRRLDWDNLTEEIEHLAKLENSSPSERRREWIDTVEREREEALEIIRDSPSLRREVPGLIARRTRAAVRRALGDLVGRGEMAQAAAARIKPDYTEERVLGDWLPEPPAPHQERNGRRRRADA